MFGIFRSRPRRRSRTGSLSACIESLEDRTLLSATTTAVLDVSSVTTQAALPLSEDFSDGVADGFVVQTGSALVDGGRYEITAADDGDGVSIIDFADPLPSDLEIAALLNADPGSTTRLSNGFIIFDYVSPTDFKFAGAYVGANQWVIGHRDASGWVTDAMTSSTIDALADYNLNLRIQNDGLVTLSVDGVEMVSITFALPLTDGAVGLGTRDAVSRFDDVFVHELAPPVQVNLPLSEDFSDGSADGFVTQAGTAFVTGGRYQITATDDGDGVSTIDFADALPSDLEINALINADPASTTLLSNGFIIFDYVSPTDFKFAGAYVGVDQWVIGHRDASGWVTDAMASSAIDAQVDHNLSLTIQNDSQVTLSVDGTTMVSFTFDSSLTDGAIGFGTRDAVSRFDNVSVAAIDTGDDGDTTGKWEEGNHEWDIPPGHDVRDMVRSIIDDDGSDDLNTTALVLPEYELDDSSLGRRISEAQRNRRGR